MTATPTTAAILHRHGQLSRRRAGLLALMVVLVSAAIVADLLTGPSGLTLADVWGAISGAPDIANATQVIVWQVRLPAALLAVLVGAALSIAGAEMQTVLDNPLASPFTLGVSSAAAFGAGLALVLGLSLPFLSPRLAVVANAFGFAFASMLFLQLLVRGRGADVATLVLFGIALVFTFNALTALIQLVASADALQQLVFWGMGSLAEAEWGAVAILAAIVALVAPFSFLSAWRLTALRLGQDRARAFGVDVGRLRFLSLLRVSLLAAAAVAFVGTIGFVGLVGPHIARLVIGEDHRFFLPASALTGALVMSLASIGSKVLVPGLLLPVGIVTSLVGLPAFILLIHRQRKGGA